MATQVVTIDAGGKKFKNQTVTLGGKDKSGNIITHADVSITGVTYTRYTASGNNIVITAYDLNDKVLGTVTIKNGAKKEYVEDPYNYGVWARSNGGSPDNLFTYNYVLGDEVARKSQTLKGTAMNETFYGGYADDKMYSNGGADKFVILQGGAKGKSGDIIYGSDGDDTISFEAYDGHTYGEEGYTLYKEGDNLRINSQGYSGDTGEIETDNIIIDKYFANAPDDRIQGVDMDAYMEENYLYIEGNEKKANTLVGTEFDDKIYGGNKADKITTGDSYTTAWGDHIYAGKGNDTITIDGLGTKNIYVYEGDGDDVIDVNLSQYPSRDDYYDDEEDYEYTGAAVFDTHLYKRDEYGNLVLDDDEKPIVVADLNVNVEIGGGSNIKSEPNFDITYTKKGADLIIAAEHENGKKESVTVKNYFNLVNAVAGEDDAIVAPTNYELSVNDSDVTDLITESQFLNIAGIKVTDLITMIKKEMPADVCEMVDGVLKQIKIPSSISNANVFIGSNYNDSIVGSDNKDVMLSTGGLTNYFETGKKGQTAIVSLGTSGFDVYNVKSFEAGTLIYDNGGTNIVGMNGVNTNDIHMFSGSLAGKQVEYLTDTKGIQNIANIDIRSTIEKISPIMGVVDVKKANDSFIDKDKAKAINTALSTATSLIDKFRGVAIVSNDETDSGLSIEPKAAEMKSAPEASKKISSTYAPMIVYDKKDNMSYITSESQEMVAEGTSYLKNKYYSNMGKKFWLDEEDLMQVVVDPSSRTYDEDDINEAIADGYMDTAFRNKYFTKVKGTNYYTLSNNAINEIKNGFAEIYQNSYLGTTSDNSFSVSHSGAGAVVAAGYGNDTITFNGNLGLSWDNTKPEIYTPATAPEYQVVSSLNKGEHDTLVFKNYTFDKDLYVSGDDGPKKGDGEGINITWAGENSKFNGMYFEAETVNKNHNSGTYAEIYYNVGESMANSGYSIYNDKFNITLKDKSSTVELMATYNDKTDFANGVIEDWSKDKNNHYAVMQANRATITTGSGKSMVEYTGITVGSIEAGMRYNYGGGDAEVCSNNLSNDRYTVNLTNKTKLVIEDGGSQDDDRLQLSNDAKSAKNLRLYFNVYNNNWRGIDSDLDTAQLNLVSGKLSKSTFEIGEYDYIKAYSGKYVEGLKNGIDFNYNPYGWYNEDYCGIEHVLVSDGHGDYDYVNIDSMMDEIQSAVAGWLSEHDNYYSTDDVIANGSSKDVNSLLAVYNNFNVGDYVQNYS